MKYLLLLLLAACEVPVIEVPKEPEVVEPIKTLFPRQDWADFVFNEVMNSKLVETTMKDGREFCPNGMSANNWVHLIAAMAKRESNFKPELEYKESFKNSKGEWVISTGLLQISLESSKGYDCGMNSQSDLKDPFKNLACGVKILERWAVRDQVLSKKVSGKWTGAIARYFSVGRDSLPKTKEVLKPWCE